MWTSERERGIRVREAAAETGMVSLSGDPTGVNMGGERRWLDVYGPGGYSWRPAVGEQVLVLKTGGEQELPCVVGRKQNIKSLNPGEVYISGGNSGLLFGNGLDLQGTVMINGRALRDYIEEIVEEVLSESSRAEGE